MTTGIYRITSPTGKIYIGQSINVEQRFYFYRKGKNYKTQTRLKHSIEKHGIDKHLFEVIQTCSAEELNTQERYYQDFYDVTGPNGLNCKLQKGDGKTGKNSAESNRKRSESMKGKNRGPRPDVSERNKLIHKGKITSEKQKQQISAKLKGRTFSEERNRKVSESNKGKIKSEEHRRKLSEAKKGKPAWNKGIPRSEETKQKIRETKLRNKLAKQ
jgi:group I intron endonuclease